MKEIGGWSGEGNVVLFVCLSPPHDSQSLPTLWTKCKAGGTELELTQPEKMVGLAKRFPFMRLSLAYKQVSCQTLT